DEVVVLVTRVVVEDDAQIAAELEGVCAPRPNHIVGNVVGGHVDKIGPPETDRVIESAEVRARLVAIPRATIALANKPIAQIVDEAVTEDGGVTDSYAFAVVNVGRVV